MTTRPVREIDFRIPEYKDAKVEDYEFRSDGKLVRKDRWEKAVHSIRNIVCSDGSDFEIDDIIAAVQTLFDVANEEWFDYDEIPEKIDGTFTIKLATGDILTTATIDKNTKIWQCNGVKFTNEMINWKYNDPV